MLYFDHCATTLPYPDVIRTVAESMERYFGNPSSLHRLGVEAERLLKKAREVIGSALHVKPETIIFTSGGTESNNLAIKGAAHQFEQRGKHLITTRIEHASVYESFKQLEKNGFRVTYLPVDETGCVNPQDVKNAITDDTILISVMHVNNEMGSIQPIEEIGQMLKSYSRVLFHVDAIQSIGKLDIDPIRMGIDLLSVSAHKIRGPKGVGFLYKKAGVLLVPQLVGGGQEAGFRSGTENVPLIAGMAKAVRLAVENQPAASKHLYSLRAKLLHELKSIPQITVTGSGREEHMAPHIVNFVFPGMKPEVVVHSLEQHQIYVSSRSACASGESNPSRVLLSMGLDTKSAASGIRISMSADHTMDNVDELSSKLKLVTQQLTSMR